MKKRISHLIFGVTDLFIVVIGIFLLMADRTPNQILFPAILLLFVPAFFGILFIGLYLEEPFRMAVEEEIKMLDDVKRRLERALARACLFNNEVECPAQAASRVFIPVVPLAEKICLICPTRLKMIAQTQTNSTCI